jgi:hypothetical protein
MTIAKPPKVALITAINTENGAELVDFLLLNDYQVRQGHDEYAVVVAVDKAKAPALSGGQVILGILPKQRAFEGAIKVSQKIKYNFYDFYKFII